MMTSLAASSAQTFFRFRPASAGTFFRPVSARTISVAKPRGIPHGFAGATSNPMASRPAARARMTVRRRAEHVPDRIDDPDNVIQEQHELHAQTHKATAGANVIADEGGIHQDLNRMCKFKGTSETTSSGDVGSTHDFENEFENGKLSGCHAVGTKPLELGYDKEIKDSCKCINENAEEKKPPWSLDWRLHFLDLVWEVICMDGVIIPISQQSLVCPMFMWQMVQPCLRVISFFGFGITLAVGFAAMYYGMVLILKEKSTTSCITVRNKLGELPGSLDSCPHFLDLVREVITMRRVIIPIMHECLRFMWHMAQPCMRVGAFFGLGIMLVVGFTTMYYGMVVILKAKSTTSCITVETKQVELGYDKEIKDSCKCVNKDEEEKKPPKSLDLRPHFLYLVREVIAMRRVIIPTGHECLRFMWQMAQPCMRFGAFFGLGITLAIGFATMYYGMVVILKVKSTTSCITIETKRVELGYDKEIKDSFKCVNKDAEENKPHASLDSRLHFLNLMWKVINVCKVIIPIRQQMLECPQFMWQMVQPCMRVISFFGLGITLVVGLAAMYYGMVVILKAKSTTNSA